MPTEHENNCYLTKYNLRKSIHFSGYKRFVAHSSDQNFVEISEQKRKLKSLENLQNYLAIPYSQNKDNFTRMMLIKASAKYSKYDDYQVPEGVTSQSLFSVQKTPKRDSQRSNRQERNKSEFKLQYEESMQNNVSQSIKSNLNDTRSTDSTTTASNLSSIHSASRNLSKRLQSLSKLANHNCRIIFTPKLSPDMSKESMKLAECKRIVNSPPTCVVQAQPTDQVAVMVTDVNVPVRITVEMDKHSADLFSSAIWNEK